MKKYLFLSFFIVTSLLADFEYKVTNTNFTINQEDLTYNYNRLRLENDYTQENYYATFIGDIVNYYGEKYTNSLEFDFIKQLHSDTSFQTQSAFYDYNKGSLYAKVYRFYGGYEDENNNLVIGLQNISMGVGKFWTPTNIFNPRNTYALEPDETFGVMALNYIRSFSATSSVMAVVSQREDKTLKYALRYQAFLEYADLAVDFVKSDDTLMFGYEIQGSLLDTGVELQSEGAYIEATLKDDVDKQNFYQATVGADYGFRNNMIFTAEVLYSSQTFTNAEIVSNLDSELIANLVDSNFYGAASLEYNFNIFLATSLTYIESFNKSNMKFISPTFTYTLNDYNSFTLGAMIEDNRANILNTNRYYFRYSLAF